MKKMIDLRSFVMRGACSLSLLMAGSPAFAKTTTWKTGWTGSKETAALDFNSTDNWDNGVPVAGDIVVIPELGGTAYNNWLKIGGSLDIGAEGLTLQVDASYFQCDVVFSGSGSIKKTGKGRLGVSGVSTFAGGTFVSAGEVNARREQSTFGSAPIVLQVTGSAQDPKLSTDAWGCGIANDIQVTGSRSTPLVLLATGQEFRFRGKLMSDVDLIIQANNGKVYFDGGIEMPGRLLTAKVRDWSTETTGGNAPSFVISKSVNASIKKELVASLQFKAGCVGTGRDNDLTVSKGSVLFESGATWAGTNIVMETNSTEFKVNGADAICDQTSMAITGLAKIAIVSGVSLQLKKLAVNGQTIEEDVYAETDLPNVVSGAGALIVSSGKRTTWLGGVTGTGVAPQAGTPMSIYDPANWDNGVPAPGDTLVFTNKTSWNTMAFVGPFGDSFDIGEKGVVIECNGGNTKFGINFTGSGKITKIGNGNFGLAVDSSHTGGTLVRAGVFEIYKGSLQFGTGPIELLNSTLGKPRFLAESWGMSLKNDVLLTGDGASNILNDLGQEFVFYGTVTATHDFGVSGNHGNITFAQGVSAPGHAVTANVAPKYTDQTADVYFKKIVDADVIKVGSGKVFLQSALKNGERNLSVNAGACVCQSACEWSSVSVTASNGAALDISANVTVQTAAFSVDGQPKPEGVYTAAKLPGVVTGPGKLRVGGPFGMVLIFR